MGFVVTECFDVCKLLIFTKISALTWDMDNN
jgi:hypothetical protein